MQHVELSEQSGKPGHAQRFEPAGAVNSLGLLPEIWVSALIQLDTVLLAMAMGALGLRTHAGALRQAGVRPLLLALALFCFLTVGGYCINRVVTYWAMPL